MTPMESKTVKMKTDTFDRVHRIAEAIRYSDNRFITASVEGMLDMIQGKAATVPELVVMVRTTMAYRQKPVTIPIPVHQETTNPT